MHLANIHVRTPGPPEGIRTPDLQNRNLLRYPAAPRAETNNIIHQKKRFVNKKFDFPAAFAKKCPLRYRSVRMGIDKPADSVKMELSVVWSNHERISDSTGIRISEKGEWDDGICQRKAGDDEG